MMRAFFQPQRDMAHIIISSFILAGQIFFGGHQDFLLGGYCPHLKWMDNNVIYFV
jgi:hypothetical protein